MLDETKKTLDRIRDMDSVEHLNLKDISTAKNYIKELFLPLLPYTAKNGIYFSSNPFFSCSEGSIFGNNIYNKNNDCGLMLYCSERVGDGSTSYNTSIRVKKVDKYALEDLANALEDKMVSRAQLVIDRFNKLNKKEKDE